MVSCVKKRKPTAGGVNNCDLVKPLRVLVCFGLVLAFFVVCLALFGLVVALSELFGFFGFFGLSLGRVKNLPTPRRPHAERRAEAPPAARAGRRRRPGLRAGRPGAGAGAGAVTLGGGHGGGSGRRMGRGGLGVGGVGGVGGGRVGIS